MISKRNIWTQLVLKTKKQKTSLYQVKHKVIICNNFLQGFKLEFHFSPNEYFSNSVLTKEYFMRFKPEEKDPLNYEGPEIVKSKVKKRRLNIK